jgi:hypothetical protein
VPIKRVALVAFACAAAALAAVPSLASARDDPLVPGTNSLVPPVPLPVPLPLPLPLPLSVDVVPAPGTSGPRPTGTVTVAALGMKLVERAVGSTTDLALTASALAAAGQNVTVTYSGDDFYERSEPRRVAFPGDEKVTIVARLRDSAPPVIEIVSPGDGVQYTVGERVVALYSCKDAGDRPVSRCEGPVATGGLVDTATPGTYSFAVSAADASGNSDAKTITFTVGSPAAAVTPPPASGSGGADTPPSAQPATPATPAAAAPPVTAAAPAAAAAGSEPARSPSERSQSLSRKVRAKAAAKPTTRSGDEDAARPVSQELKPYDPRSQPVQTVGILVAAFTLLQLGTAGGGLALARGGGGVGRSASRGGSHGRSGSRGGSQARSGSDSGSGPQASFDYEAVSVEHLGGGAAAYAIGDRSWTWGWPGTAAITAVGAAVPARLAPRSPLLARVTADGTYLRAIFGSASLIGLLAGVGLGIAALQDVGGEAIPPAAVLTIAIAMLGVFDAMAGFVAVLIFTSGVLALGGIDSNAHLRLMLGLGALWFVVPVLAGAVRPLRREPTRKLDESWDRAADFVIASLIGAWAVQKIVLALPGLAGVELPLTAYANEAAYCVLAALVIRLALETLAAHLYPRRLDIAAPGDLPDPSAALRLAATALRVGIFVFFAYIVVGTSWQLWVGAALFVIPQVLAVYEEHVPNSPGLFRALPKGLVELVLMLLVGSAVGALLISTMDENAETFVANSFVLLSLPGFVLSLLQLFGRDGDEPRIGWGKRIAGVGLLAVGILAALGILL